MSGGNGECTLDSAGILWGKRLSSGSAPVGQQDILDPNTALWHKDCFDVKTTEKKQMQEKLPALSLSA